MINPFREFIAEGEYTPFFLPYEHCYSRRGVWAAFWLFAPMMLVLTLVKNMFRCFWSDCLFCVREWRRKP